MNVQPQAQARVQTSLHLIGAGAIAAAIAPVLWRRAMCACRQPVPLGPDGTRTVMVPCCRVWQHDGGCWFKLPTGCSLFFPNHGASVDVPEPERKEAPSC
jgi:hypothetical protein